MLKRKHQNKNLALTPPMGWSTWNHFKGEIDDTLIREIADTVVDSGLAAAGYKYVNIDDLWQVGRVNNELVVDPVRFPHGMADLVHYVHSKGLKFGLYTCAGTKTCEGRPGSFGYEETDMATFAKWGVDLVKVDWCHAEGLDAAKQYKKFRRGIKKTKRPMILSICEWGKNYPWLWGRGVGELWRISSDARGDWGKIVKIADRNSGLFSYAGPGGWNDPDLLEIGNNHLTFAEQKSHYYLWVIMAAPLILGNDVRTLSVETLKLLNNPEVIAVNQDKFGIQGRILIDLNFEAQIWVKPLLDGSVALLFINLSDCRRTVSASLAELDLPEDVLVRDLGAREILNFEKDIAFDLGPHDSKLLKVSSAMPIA